MPATDPALGFTGKHRTRESAADEVVNELVADRAGRAAGADHGDRRRVEDAPDRRDDCRSVAILDVLVELVRRRQREADADHAAVELLVTSKPAWRNTSIIARLSGSVSAKNRSIPLLLATAARCSSITVAKPAALLAVFDDECHLGGIVVIVAPVVAHHGDDQSVELGNKREPIAVVDLGEMMELRLRDLRDR